MTRNLLVVLGSQPQMANDCEEKEEIEGIKN